MFELDEQAQHGPLFTAAELLVCPVDDLLPVGPYFVQGEVAEILVRIVAIAAGCQVGPVPWTEAAGALRELADRLVRMRESES